MLGLFYRLQRDLVDAYTATTCSNGLIERLTDELACLRNQLEHTSPIDEQTSDWTLPGSFAHHFESASV